MSLIQSKFSVTKSMKKPLSLGAYLRTACNKLSRS